MLTIRNRSLATLAAAALCTALAWPAMAQTNVLGNTAQTQAQQDKDQKYQQARAERHAKRMAEFKKALQITPSQEAAWMEFEKQMQARKGHHAQNRAAISQMSTPERLDFMRKHRTERMARADARDQAVKTLYAALSPEQQKTMDTQWQKAMHKHHHGGRHMHKMGHQDM
jgi:hypothetical protein